MCEQDSDVTRWGLNFLDVDQHFGSIYDTDTSLHDVDINREQHSKDSQQDEEYCNLDNKEIHAYTLQEKSSQVSLNKGTELSGAEGDTWQVSNGIQEWSGSPIIDYCEDVHNGGLQETNVTSPSSSCSSNEDQSFDAEDFIHTLEITDELELDGEVGKRLNQMISAPHVPRTNGDMPFVYEATSDHLRLLDRLQLYNLVERKVEGDGNCQFRALSDQFYRSPDHHDFVRRQVVNQLKLHPELYEEYVPMRYGDYVKKMSKSGEWGDHVTLQAAADTYGVKILVVTSFIDTCSIEVLPKVQKSKRALSLVFLESPC